MAMVRSGADVLDDFAPSWIAVMPRDTSVTTMLTTIDTIEKLQRLVVVLDDFGFTAGTAPRVTIVSSVARSSRVNGILILINLGVALLGVCSFPLLNHARTLVKPVS